MDAHLQASLSVAPVRISVQPHGQGSGRGRVCFKNNFATRRSSTKFPQVSNMRTWRHIAANSKICSPVHPANSLPFISVSIFFKFVYVHSFSSNVV